MIPDEFSPDAIAAFQAHALEAWPDEACGAITAEGYVRFANVAADPRRHFDCDAERRPLLVEGRILAMVHSHPDDPDHPAPRGDFQAYGPSAHDIAQQQADAVAWGICLTDGAHCTEPFFWGEDVPVPPLIGRLFRHGPAGSDGRGDCYALIRDYYRLERGITLPEGMRDWEWWTRGEDLYTVNQGPAGFRAISADQALPGDVFLAQIRSPVPNHGGILVRPGYILHHLQGRMSREDSIMPWRKQIVRWLRHEGAKTEPAVPAARTGDSIMGDPKFDTGSEAYPDPVPNSGVNKPAQDTPKDEHGTDSGGNEGGSSGTGSEAQ